MSAIVGLVAIGLLAGGIAPLTSQEHRQPERPQDNRPHKPGQQPLSSAQAVPRPGPTDQEQTGGATASSRSSKQQAEAPEDEHGNRGGGSTAVSPPPP